MTTYKIPSEIDVAVTYEISCISFSDKLIMLAAARKNSAAETE